jgi:hypothetical protein
MILMITEARARFLFEFGIRETDGSGTGIIVFGELEGQA